MKKSDCTILVLSCDKYWDLWSLFFMLFKKYWYGCPYPVFLGSNTKTYQSKDIRTILSGPDTDWSTSLITILKKIDTPYVFLWLDDIFPIHEVNMGDFNDALLFFKRHKAKHMHVWSTPKPDRILEHGKYGEYAKGAPYRATAFGFWEREYLSHLLLPGETPWNFEIMGSYRTRYTDGFYCSMEPLLERIHVVEKGQIFPDAYAYCLKNGIPLDTNKRTVIAGGQEIQSNFQKFYFNLMMKIPWKIRLSLMNTFRKLFISY